MLRFFSSQLVKSKFVSFRKRRSRVSLNNFSTLLIRPSRVNLTKLAVSAFSLMNHSNGRMATKSMANQPLRYSRVIMARSVTASKLALVIAVLNVSKMSMKNKMSTKELMILKLLESSSYNASYAGVTMQE